MGYNARALPDFDGMTIHTLFCCVENLLIALTFEDLERSRDVAAFMNKIKPIFWHDMSYRAYSGPRSGLSNGIRQFMLVRPCLWTGLRCAFVRISGTGSFERLARLALVDLHVFTRHELP